MPLFPGNATNNFPGLITLDGDLSGTPIFPSVTKINGASIPAAGSLIDGYVLQVSGLSTLTYAPINLAGGSHYLNGLLPKTNQEAQSLSGDASGTTASSTIIKINGTTVPALPAIGQVLTATSTTTATWQSTLTFRRSFLFMGA